MFMAESNLSMREYAVSRAIMELHQEHEYINAQMIAKKIKCEETTVYRSFKTLRDAGVLKIVGGSSRTGGFIYEYLGD